MWVLYGNQIMVFPVGVVGEGFFLPSKWTILESPVPFSLLMGVKPKIAGPLNQNRVPSKKTDPISLRYKTGDPPPPVGCGWVSRLFHELGGCARPLAGRERLQVPLGA